MRSSLGEFLRARRRVTTVDQVGLPEVGDHRRTPGLRRDEVAMLAGVSTDYYTRLEQGRERHPSDQVLDALAEALLLDPDATDHLHELARARRSRHNRVGQADQLSSHLLQLVDRWEHTPAFIVNRRWDVLARNTLSAAVCGWLENSDNMMRLVFLNPAAQEFFPADWEREAYAYAAHLRAMVGAGGDDPFLLELVEELSRGSATFRQLWARHDVHVRTHESIRLHHHDVGDLALHFEGFAINSAPGHVLVVGQAEPGSPSADGLAKLGWLAVSNR
ncbi:helix-turn-helix domain-containing protein [Planotetraspora silvatica]|nr:helix-turn-helix transcriptional regulator [Planotetraspora silvatica]